MRAAFTVLEPMLRAYSPDDGTGCRGCILSALCWAVAVAIVGGILLILTRTPAHGDGDWRTAVVTSYCSRCSTPHTAWDEALRPWFVAADPRYHRRGERIQFEMGDGTRRTYRVEDTGGAIKGRHRFDLCRGMVRSCTCAGFGRQRLRYRVVGR